MNEILSGRYEGKKIMKDPNKNLAYVSLFDGYGTNITRVEVTSVEVINSTTTTDDASVLKGALFAGAAGAMIASASATQNETLIKITWKNGETSIAKVSNLIFEAITVGMNTDYSEEKLKTVDTDRKTSVRAAADEDFSFKILMFVVAIIWFIVCSVVES